MFGSTAATAYTISSATSLTLVTSPAEPAGTVDVTVIGSAGTSPDTGADQFTYSNSTWYQAAPTTAPSVRSVYAEAYDPATGQTILFGGATTGHLPERHLGLERGQLGPAQPRYQPE